MSWILGLEDGPLSIPSAPPDVASALGGTTATAGRSVRRVGEIFLGGDGQGLPESPETCSRGSAQDPRAEKLAGEGGPCEALGWRRGQTRASARLHNPSADPELALAPSRGGLDRTRRLRAPLWKDCD